MIKDIIENIKQAEKDADNNINQAISKSRDIVSEAERNSEHLMDLNNALIKQDALKIHQNAEVDAEKAYQSIIDEAKVNAVGIFDEEKEEKAISYIVGKFLEKWQ